MTQTQFSLAAEPTQQRILALAIAMKPFGYALKLNGSVTVAVPADYTPHIMKHSMGIYMAPLHVKSRDFPGPPN